MSESEIKRTLQSLLPGTRYSVRARAYNNYNVYSEWSEALEFVTPEDDGVPGPVTAISSSFTSPDLLLSWDAPSLNVDGSACNDIAFYRLEITGYAGVTRIYKSLSESFQLTYATQKKDFNTPIPNPHIVISVVDTANNESTPVSTDPLNLAPSQPSAPVVDAIPGALSVVMSSEGVEDFYYFVLQVSQDNTTWSNLYSGADDNYHHAVAGGLTRYYRYKVVDRFGQESIYSVSESDTAISLSSTHSHYLEDLIDVNATPNDGDVLYWDGSFWSATPGGGIGGGGGGPSAEYLNDLLDVDTTGVSNGKFLRYNSPNWTPQTASLDDLSDVDTSGVATNKVLKYNGSQWIPQDDNTVSYLNSLLDVDTTGQSIGDVLTFDGYQWVPATPTSGGSGGGGTGTDSGNWTLLDHIMGSSTTGWANVNGSSLTSSGSELSVVGVGGAGSINRYDAKYIPEIAIVEADVRYDSFTGSDAQIAIGFMRRSGYSNSSSVSLYTGPGDGTTPTVYITNWATGVGEGFDAPNPYTTGTWYTLRVVKIGSSFQAYLDGSYIGSASVSPNNGNDKLGIFAYNADASVRNIKIWQSPIDFLAATPTWPGGGGLSLVYVSTTPPPSPLDGELWWDSGVGTLSMWYEHSHVWVEVSGGSGGSGGTGTAYISPDPPATPASGQFWFDEDTGSTYVYYDSATPSPVWVEVGGSGGGGMTWTEVANLDGSTVTGLSNYGGTWTSDGSIIKQTALGANAWAWHTSVSSPIAGPFVAEVEYRRDGGWNSTVGLALVSKWQYDVDGYFREGNRFYFSDGDGPANIVLQHGAPPGSGGQPDRNRTIGANTNLTWRKLRVTCTSHLTFWLDGTPYMNIPLQTYIGSGYQLPFDRVALFSSQGNVGDHPAREHHFRNFKLWVADMNYPA